MKAKRLIAAVLIVCMLLCIGCMLTGCAKKGECEECRQTETLNKYVDHNGDIHWLCSDCTKLAKMFGY